MLQAISSRGRIRSSLVGRFVLSLSIGWFGMVIPVLMADAVRNISWGLRLVLPDWIVNGTFAVLLLAWIALIWKLMERLWQRPRSKVTYGHADQRLAMPRPFPIKPRSMITPIATTNMPLKLETPPNDDDAKQ